MIKPAQPISFSPQQVERAMRAYLLAMRRESATRHPDIEPRVPNFDTLSFSDQAMLIKCMTIALRAATTQPASTSS